MRVVRFVLSFLLVLGSSPRLKSQLSTATPQRDTQAVGAIQNALAAMGGASTMAQVHNVIVQGSMLPAQGNTPIGSFTMKDQFGAQVHEFKDSFQSAALTQTFVSGHGKPGLLSNGHTKNFNPWTANFRLPVHLPGIILKGLLADTNCNIAFAGQTTINGLATIHIQFHIDTDIVQQTLSVQDWYFDPSTTLPLRVEYRIPDSSDPLLFISAAADFSDFRPVQGVLFPFRIASFEDGKPQNVLALTSVVINQSVSSSEFDKLTAVAQ